MEFNPDPTKQANEILFSCKKSSPNHPQLIFNGSAVVTVNEQKHLGLVLEPSLSFEKHLNDKIIKAKKNIGILKHLSKFLPLKTLDQMYKAIVRSHLDYFDIIYHISKIHQQPLGMTLNILMEKVERVQYQAALAITGAWQGSSRSKIYEELGWETLSDRRKCKRVLQIHKIINKNTLSYLKDKLPPNGREMFSGNIPTSFRTIICKSNRYMNSFFPHGIATWNLFMEICKYNEVPSIGILKKDIISLIRPDPKSSFNIHNPVGLRYLFQLRVNLSPLKGHKWCHNFIDTTSVICHCNQELENTSHFLFAFPFYVTQRAKRMTSVNVILHDASLDRLDEKSKLCLYGHPSLSNSDNKNVISSTLKYIEETKRFTT